MPINFSSSSELPPLHPESVYPDDTKMPGDITKSHSWYGQFLQASSNPISDEKVHMLILDFLITEGFHEIALSFAKEAGIDFKPEDVRDICHLPERDAIRNAVLKGELDAAIELINKLCPNLLEKNKLLTFQILRQQLVELIRKKNVVEALQFAQDKLVDKCEQNKEELDKLEQTCALLAFDHPEESPFGKLMHPSQRLALSSMINEAIFNELGSPPTSRLYQLMCIMVWNRYQTMMRGDVTSPINKKLINQIAKDMFSEKDDDDLLMEESL